MTTIFPGIEHTPLEQSHLPGRMQHTHSTGMQAQLSSLGAPPWLGRQGL